MINANCLKSQLTYLSILVCVFINILYLIQQEYIYNVVKNSIYTESNTLKARCLFRNVNKLERNTRWIIVNSEYKYADKINLLGKHSGFKLLEVDKILEKNAYKTSFNEYNRKNIGYLHAIENGAKYIYDSDNEIRPFIDLNESFSFDEHDFGPILDCDVPSLVNPFAHFGQTNYWPNGFPSETDNHSSVYICGKRRTSMVQQAMINGDNYNMERLFGYVHSLINYFNFIKYRITLIYMG